MRPLEIVISAFGPYAEQTKINMEQLGENGIYLITGDTGAGKTTIFDAIIYALYGEASGSVRTADMFRSKYATPDTPTFVSLKFLMRGEEYFIKRNPEYMRPSKRGKDKFTKETASAELILSDGSVITGIAAVNSAVIDIIGLNKSQFSQIAMIAQGDFLKLLLADTKQRIGIFREIFSTKPYLDLQERLKGKANALLGEVSDAKKSILQYIADVDCDEKSSNNMELKNIKMDTGLGTLSETVSLIERILEEDKFSLEEVSLNIKLLDEKLTVNNQLLGKCEQLGKNEAELERLKVLLPKLKADYDAFEADYLKEKDNESVRETLAIDIQNQTNELRKYDDFDAAVKNERLLVEKCRFYENELKSKKELESECSNKFNTYKEELSTYRDCEAEYERTNSKVEGISQRLSMLKEIEQLIQTDKDAINDYYRARKNYETSNEQYEDCALEYNRLDKLYFDGQAGILADKLMDNEPCPVCGSIHHPKLAKLEKNVPTKVELDSLKKELDFKQNKRSELSSIAGMKKGQLETVHNNLFNQFNAFLENCNEEAFDGHEVAGFDLENMIEATKMIDERVNLLIRKLSSKMKEISDRKTKLNKDILRAKQLEELVPKLEKKKVELEVELINLEKSLAVTKVQLENSTNITKELKAALKYENRAVAVEAIEELKQKKSEFDEAFLGVTKKLEVAKLEVEKTKQQIVFLEESIRQADLPKCNLEALKFEIEQIECEKNRYLESKKKLDLRIAGNLRAVNAVKEVSARMEEKENRLKSVKALSDTANGTVSGKERIMLETYVQMSFFDRIIRKANLRFMTMTSGQYELIRSGAASNLRSQSGLELDVIDHYNGTVRSVKSLSGGESFKASLSLALGLSDEIQSQAGGIQIDTMFVDEGFGSLDEESLRQAISALTGLADSNRLVGIISHVNELKDRIDKQIVVTKEINGGSKAVCSC